MKRLAALLLLSGLAHAQSGHAILNGPQTIGRGPMFCTAWGTQSAPKVTQNWLGNMVVFGKGETAWECFNPSKQRLPAIGQSLGGSHSQQLITGETLTVDYKITVLYEESSPLRPLPPTIPAYSAPTADYFIPEPITGKQDTISLTKKAKR